MPKLQINGKDVTVGDEFLQLSSDDQNAAVDEIALSDFHMGRNPKTEGKSYCEWEEHLFRSTEQFERWLQKAQEAEKQK